MEDTEAKVAAVRVLRHSFRPSEQLGVAIDNFMRGGVTRPRFLYASKMGSGRFLAAQGRNTVACACPGSIFAPWP